LSDLICPSCGSQLEWSLAPAREELPPAPAQTQVHVDEGDKRLLIPVAEVAVRLGVSRNTVYQELQSGRLPSVRLGSRRLVPLRQLTEFLARAVEDSAPIAYDYSPPRNSLQRSQARSATVEEHQAEARTPSGASGADSLDNLDV
jgi:excisionase family DNA binding protein